MARTTRLTIGLVASVLLVHGAALLNPFYFDDIFVLRDNAWLHGLWPPWGWFGTFFIDSGHTFPGYRPTLMLSFWINRLLLGESEASLRLGNIALHIVNALLVVAVLRRLSRTALPWVAGFLFALHPIQT